MLTLAAAVLLASTADVTNGLRNLAQMHSVAEIVQLRQSVGHDVPADLPLDPWGTAYRIEGQRIVSAGSDQQFDENPPAGQFEGTAGDVVFADGVLVRSNRNWLYAQVEPSTESAAALDKLREAELSFMFMRTPLLQDLLRTKLTIEAMQRGEAKLDAWGTPIRVEGTRSISAGADRLFDTTSWDRAAGNEVSEDIIVENGAVVRGIDPQVMLREKAPTIVAVAQPVDPPLPSDGKYRLVGPDVTAPVIVNRVEPRYFEEYRKARITGIVILQAAISDKGAVENVRLLKSRAPELDAAAMDAVRKWTFQPGKAGGKAVPVLYTLTVNFKLK